MNMGKNPVILKWKNRGTDQAKDEQQHSLR